MPTEPYARVNLLDYFSGTPVQSNGVSGVGSDMKPAAEAALDDLTARFGRGELFIPPGLWRFASGISAAKMKGHAIVGAGSQASILMYDASSGALLHWSGVGGYTGGGARGVGMWAIQGGTTALTTAILLQGNATSQPSQMIFEDIYCTASAGNFWYQGFFAYGRDRNTGAQGIRIVTMTQVQVFACRSLGMYFDNVVGLQLDNCGTYAPWSPSGTVTASTGSPAVFTWAGHGLQAAFAVTFQSTGALPGGLSAGTRYYVVNPTANTFQVSTTLNGPPVATSSSGTGTLTAKAMSTGADIYFTGGPNNGPTLFEKSTQVHTSNLGCNGRLTVDQAVGVTLMGTCEELAWGTPQSGFVALRSGPVFGAQPASVKGFVYA